MSDIRNLVMFMADGIRWDTHPESVRERGTTFRTVASSLHTPTAIASMLTGLYLPSHHVRGFTDPLPKDRKTILDVFENSAISDFGGNFNNEIYEYLLGRYDRKPLSEMTEPFAWFMRDPGGHAPYDGFDENLGSTESVRSYLRRHAGDNSRLQSDYKAGVAASTRRFEQHVINTLREQNLLENTLIVYVSDHGQMLGEHGHVGESYPACPEIVYVPTTFIHPDLRTTERSELFRHVDLPSTVEQIINPSGGIGQTDGINILDDQSAPSVGLNFYDRPYPSFRGQFYYTLNSVWDRNGGHVFNESNLGERIRLLVGFLSRIPAGAQLRRSRNLRGFRYLLESQYSWNSPSFSRDEARALLDSATEESKQRRELDMDSKTQENLRDLGYL